MTLDELPNAMNVDMDASISIHPYLHGENVSINAEQAQPGKVMYIRIGKRSRGDYVMTCVT